MLNIKQDMRALIRGIKLSYTLHQGTEGKKCRTSATRKTLWQLLMMKPSIEIGTVSVCHRDLSKPRKRKTPSKWVPLSDRAGLGWPRLLINLWKPARYALVLRSGHISRYKALADFQIHTTAYTLINFEFRRNLLLIWEGTHRSVPPFPNTK